MMTSSIVYIPILIAFLFVQNSLVASQDYEIGDDCTMKDGRLGVCTKMSKCEWFKKGLKKKVLKYPRDVVRCAFEGNEEIICCEDDIQTKTQLRRKSAIACDLFPKQEVGLSFHIVGGRIVEEPTEFPFIAILGYPSEKSGIKYDWNCGATLISDRYLITAAHCIPRNTPPVIARLGITNPQNPEDSMQELLVKRTIVHPDRRYTNYDDIALIELDGKVTYNDNISPACLYNTTDDLPAGTIYGAEGWGVTNPETGVKADLLQKVNLTSFDQNECNKTLSTIFRQNKKLPEGIRSSQLCARGDVIEGVAENLRRDTCQGDSGGPLQINQAGRFYLVGLVSFGAGCGTDLPSVYTRVAFYLNWIEDNVWS